MIKPPWIKWSPKDALDGTIQLEPLEELAYRRILDMIYSSGDALEDNDKSLRYSTKTNAKWPAIKARLIKLEKIEIIDGWVTHPRCREILQECERFFAQKSEAGSASAEKRSDTAKYRKKNETTPTGVGGSVETRVPTCEPTNKIEDIGGGGSAPAHEHTHTHEEGNPEPETAQPSTETAKQPKGSTGTTPQPEKSSIELAAAAVAVRFRELRDELWTDWPNFPAPPTTIRAQAEGYLMAGATKDLILDVLERGMRQAKEREKSATGSLSAFHNSITDAISRHAAALNQSHQKRGNHDGTIPPRHGATRASDLTDDDWRETLAGVAAERLGGFGTAAGDSESSDFDDGPG